MFSNILKVCFSAFILFVLITVSIDAEGQQGNQNSKDQLQVQSIFTKPQQIAFGSRL